MNCDCHLWLITFSDYAQPFINLYVLFLLQVGALNIKILVTQTVMYVSKNKSL